MSVEGKNETITIAAGADLTGLQYRIISVAGTLSVSNITAGGVLQSNTVGDGEHATLVYQGNMKAMAGGTIAAGNTVTVTASGTLAVGSSGVVGKALAAASSGALVNFIGDFSVAG